MQSPSEFPRSSIAISNELELKIMLDDLNFAEAQYIYYDYTDASINAILDGEAVCIGMLPEDVALNVSPNTHLSLTAFNEDGNMVVLDTKIQSLH